MVNGTNWNAGILSDPKNLAVETRFDLQTIFSYRSDYERDECVFNWSIMSDRGINLNIDQV